MLTRNRSPYIGCKTPPKYLETTTTVAPRRQDLRERSAEVWAQCRAVATELGEAEAALARRRAEQHPWQQDEISDVCCKA